MFVRIYSFSPVERHLLGTVLVGVLVAVGATAVFLG